MGAGSERGRARARRAYWNLRLLGLPQLVTDLWLIVITALVVIALTGQQSTLDSQREGRAVAIRTLCGAEQGVIAAGRHELLLAGARREVGVYSRIIALAVEREAGIRGLVAPDGQLRCGPLLGAARANP